MVMPGGGCRVPVRSGGVWSVREGEGGARRGAHPDGGVGVKEDGTRYRQQAAGGARGMEEGRGKGLSRAERAAGTAEGAGHTQGPGGVGPMR